MLSRSPTRSAILGRHDDQGVVAVDHPLVVARGRTPQLFGWMGCICAKTNGCRIKCGMTIGHCI
ncbi:MAG: hypothetical protein ACOCW2_02040 [Chitinivibrionales bacterium]